MVKINLESGMYDFVASCLSVLISAGSACICNAFCNNIIADTQARGKNTTLMRAGKHGLEAAVMFGVTPNIRTSIDELAETYNKFVDMCDAYEEKKTKSNYVEVK